METDAATVAGKPSSQQRQAAPSTLPPGWIELKDPSGRLMFFNTSTGQSSWQRPMVRKLPPGWQKSQTPDGKVIFIHPESGSCSYEWPAAQSPRSDFAGKVPLTRSVTAPSQPVGMKSGDRPPNSNRSPSTPSYRAQGGSLMTANVDKDSARKVVPGINQAYAIRQLSENNNCGVLSKALVHEIGVTSSAMKDTTIMAASLAARQAKTVTKTMMSPKRMGKISKKMVIHTGAVGIKTGRACKGLMHEMVEAADKRGKYQPKQHQFVPNVIQPPQDPQKVVRADKHWQDQAQQVANQGQMRPLSQAQPIPQKLVDELKYAQPPSNRTSRSPQTSAPTPKVPPEHEYTQAQEEHSAEGHAQFDPQASATQQPRGIPFSTLQAPGKPGLSFNPRLPVRKPLKHQVQLPDSSNIYAPEATYPAVAGMNISGKDAAGPAAAIGKASSTTGGVSTNQNLKPKMNPRQISSSNASLQSPVNATDNATTVAHPVPRATTSFQSSTQVQGPPQSVQTVARGPANRPSDSTKPPASQQATRQISSHPQVRPSIRPSVTKLPARQSAPLTSIQAQLTTARPQSTHPPSYEQTVRPQLHRPSKNRPAARPVPGINQPVPLMYRRHTSAPASQGPQSYSQPQPQPIPSVTDNSELEAYQPYDSVDGTQPYDSVDGTQPYDSVDGTQPYDSVDGTQPYDSVDGTQPYDFVDGTQPYDSVDGTQQYDSVDGTQLYDSVDGPQSYDSDSSTTAMDQQNPTGYSQVDMSAMQDAGGADQTTLVDESDSQQQMDSQDAVAGQDTVGDDTTYYQETNQVDVADQSSDGAGYQFSTEEAAVVDDGTGGEEVYYEESGAVQSADGSEYEYDYACEVDVSGDAYAADDGGDVVCAEDDGGDVVYAEDDGSGDETYAADDGDDVVYAEDDGGDVAYAEDDGSDVAYAEDDGSGDDTYATDNGGDDTCAGDDGGDDMYAGDD
jgi:hypothetical protein